MQKFMEILLKFDEIFVRYQNGEFDVAGFSVGVVERSTMLPDGTVASGNVVIGLASSGVHLRVD